MNRIFTWVKKVDLKFFFIIYNNFNRWRLSSFFVIIARFSHYLFFISYFLGFIYIFCLGDFVFTVKYLAVPLITILVNRKLRKFFKVERPYETLKIKCLIPRKKSYSFPSNHSASAFVIFVCLTAISRWAFILMPIVVLTGVSRVVTGVHYPLDIIFGFLVGAFFGSFMFL